MPVPLMDPHSQVAPLLDRVTAAMQDVVRSGRFVLGPRVAEAEERLAARVGAAHGVGVANGTDALVIALEALGIERGDEVICPSFTFFATAEAIARAGAVPVFADIDPATFCLDPEAVAAAVTPRTRAVCAVHLFGHPADAPALRAVCERHGLALLEDAAQAIGARLGDELCGSMGDAATFSFYPTKNLPCFGDGGLITTSDQQVAEVAAAPALPRLARQGHLRPGGLQLAPRRAAGGGPARARAPARRLERPPHRRGRPLRGARARRAGGPPGGGRWGAARLPPVRVPDRGPRRPQGLPARARDRGHRRTTTPRSTASRPSPTWACPRARCPRPSGPRART